MGREPASIDAAELRFTGSPEISFPGFGNDAFAMLRLLRMSPLLTTYHAHRSRFDSSVMAPFRLLRDDLVANWVLPNGLHFETQRNVFSRIGKNDFGRGGANHRMWMAFYRPEHRRLTDVQLVFAISPDGFTLGTFCPDNPGSVSKVIRDRLRIDDSERFRTEIERTTLGAIAGGFSLHATKGRSVEEIDTPGRAFDAIRAASAWQMTRTIKRSDVELMGSDLLHAVLQDLRYLWPFHGLMLSLADEGCSHAD